MNQINDTLRSDQEFGSRLQTSTEAYVARRESLGGTRIQAGDHPGGGSGHVKCLHAHTAHQLISGDNPVGEAVLAELKWKDPKEPCVRKGS